MMTTKESIGDMQDRLSSYFIISKNPPILKIHSSINKSLEFNRRTSFLLLKPILNIFNSRISSCIIEKRFMSFYKYLPVVDVLNINSNGDFFEECISSKTSSSHTFNTQEGSVLREHVVPTRNSHCLFNLILFHLEFLYSALRHQFEH